MAPNYADAQAELADATFQRAVYGWSEFAQQDVETAIRLAQRALEIDEECVLAHSVLARAYTVQQKYDLGLAESERALQINPSDAEVLTARAAVLLWTGQIDELDRRGRARGAAQRQSRARAGAQSRHRLPAEGPLCRCGQAARGGAHALSRLPDARFPAGRRLCRTRPCRRCEGGAGAGPAQGSLPRPRRLRHALPGSGAEEPDRGKPAQGRFQLEPCRVCLLRWKGRLHRLQVGGGLGSILGGRLAEVLQAPGRRRRRRDCRSEITQLCGSDSRRTPVDRFMAQSPPNCGAYLSGLALNRSRCRALAKR